MKKYGIDIDGVLLNFVSTFKAWLTERLNIDFRDKTISDYYWYKCIDGLSKETFWKEFNVFGREFRGYSKLDFMHGAEVGMRALLDSGNDIWIITHRPEYCINDTMEYLWRAFKIPENKIVFSKGTKSWDANQLGIDVFLDDALHHVFDIAENTDARTYLMDHPYNADFEHPEVTRVYSWNDFLLCEGIYG